MPVSAVPNIEPKVGRICDVLHPFYRRWVNSWRKWRLTYEGGDAFIHKYLVKFSNRENDKEFQQRKRLAYCPAFAKAAIFEIRNAAFKRSGDIHREGGTSSYQNAVNGKDNGVDLEGSDMNYFMNIKVLEELLPMQYVGIFVDMPADVGPSLLEAKDKRPYIYIYQVEDIRSYTKDPYGKPWEYSSVLLMDHTYIYDHETNLPTDECSRYRYLYLKATEQGQRVFVKYYDHHGRPIDANGISVEETYEQQVGNLQKIPFILLKISHSLLADVANYQIAYLNLASGDIWYGSRANFPFYIEPFDPKSQSPYVKRTGTDEFDATDPETSVITTTTSDEITVGPTRGRRYVTGTNQPAFIHPSSEPMKASMMKQDQLKAEIRQLVNLSLASLNPGFASAESKGVDEHSLQNGLSYLATVLQYAENRIGYFWSLYEGSKSFPEIQYPEQHQFLSPEQIDKEIKTLVELIDKTTSLTLKKRCMKVIAELKIAEYVTMVELKKIYQEIDNADVVIGDALNIKNDIESGIVSLGTASKARGYPDGEVEKAAKDHADRIARVMVAQTDAPTDAVDDKKARGVPDLSGNPASGREEKAEVKDPTTKTEPTDPTRGPGK